MIPRLKDIPTNVIRAMQLIRSRKPMLGTDPEFFIANKAGSILPSDKFLPGKHDKLKIAENKNHTIFFDGIQAEINVPANCCRELIVSSVRQALIAAKNKIGADHDIVVQPSVRVSKACIESADPEARIFGCMPDFNAYTCGQNTPEMDATNHLYRYAGGHIHVGISSDYLKDPNKEYMIAKTPDGHLKVIKMMDYLAGVLLVLLDRSKAAVRRRDKYGKAGCFRPTPYGVEYRTPSCWWLKSPMTLSLIFGMVRLAWNICSSDGQDELLLKQMKYSFDDARCIIDESDIKEAKKFWKTLRPYVASMSINTYNPLHYWTHVNSQNINDEDKGLAESIKSEAYDGKSILAMIDYMIANGGVEPFISSDILQEWQVDMDNGKAQTTSRNVSYNGIRSRLWVDSEGKRSWLKDFCTYSTDYFNNII
jgi:hypothetical protein